MEELTIEQQKKLVADSMGWKWIPEYRERGYYPISARVVINGTEISIDKWLPEEDVRWWPTIWKCGNEILDFNIDYIANLISLLGLGNLNWDVINLETLMKIHTAPPEICWEALIKTLSR